MGNYKRDIERYLRGELSAEEMHALEKRALADPFLAEALEGAERAGHEHFSLDMDLLQHSMHQKLKVRKSRIISLNGWSISLGIAASLLLLVVSTYIVLNTIERQKESELVAQQEKLSPAQQEATSATKDSVQGEQKNNYLSLNTPAETRPAPIGEQRPSVTQRPAAETLPTYQPDSERIAQVQMEEVDFPATVRKELGREVEVALSEVPEIEKTKSDSSTAGGDVSIAASERIEAADRDDAGVAHEAKAYLKVVRGKVTAKDDNVGLPGVNVLVKGSSVGTVTDAEGNYQIAIAEDQNLVFSFIGMQSTEVAIEDRQEIDVQLEVDAAQLSEVVVTGYGISSNTNLSPNPTIHLAEPAGGRRAFKKYLEEKMQYPEKAVENKVEGKVTVQFTVESNGTLSDFKVLKGIGFGCDEEVIRLIKEGPRWSPSKRSDEPVSDKVKVRIRFDLPN
ncbi:MAG: TonB family protein [Bacteroidota bacterium]